MIKLFSATLLSLAVLLSPGIALAHVAVTPAAVTIGSFTTFSISVPNEKAVSITSVRLAIPSGLKEITPTVKTGWTISTNKSGDDITVITWTGGTIPAGQRDDFTFNAQAPAATVNLNWKAYQTYEDGSTTHWDQAPTTKETETADGGPYSVTKVLDDLTPAASNPAPKSDNTLPLVISALALTISVGGLLFKKRP
ncbi:MAG: DUF1775 domain-containing protein [Patescibacteria group bacterium]|nr:DUF1775 domain-containing protein [Patescibacteria group bacterium]